MHVMMLETADFQSMTFDMVGIWKFPVWNGRERVLAIPGVPGKDWYEGQKDLRRLHAEFLEMYLECSVVLHQIRCSSMKGFTFYIF